MLFTGRDVGAEEAILTGLANHVYPAASFMESVLEFARDIARQSPQALRRGKAALLAALDSTYDEALAREAEHQREILQSEDGAEGFIAFVEKRAPIWKGK